jgi:hypothetical protein
MRGLVPAVLIIATLSTAAFSQQRQPRRPNAAVRPAIEDVVEGFYVSQFQQQVEVNAEAFAKILPVLRQALQERRGISARRIRALTQLRMLTRQNDSEEEMKRLIREVDGADADAQASQEKFLATVDPLLDARQQANLRIFQSNIEQRIRRMIERARTSPQR